MRILCAKRWHIAPEFFEVEPDLPAMLGASGRRAVDRRSGAGLAHAAMGPARSWATTLWLRIPVVYLYDMVEKWRAFTSLPAVLAVWAARPESSRRKWCAISRIAGLWHASI